MSNYFRISTINFFKIKGIKLREWDIENGYADSFSPQFRKQFIYCHIYIYMVDVVHKFKVSLLTDNLNYEHMLFL